MSGRFLATLAVLSLFGCGSQGVSSESISEDAPPGGTVTTDTEGDGAVSADPIETSVTTPIAGSVSITETPEMPEVPNFTGLGWSVDIDAPVAAAGTPLVLTFTFDASLATQEVSVFRDGTLVPDCVDGSFGIALADPCVSERDVDSVDDLSVTVLTSRASVWTFATAGGTDLFDLVVDRLDSADLGPAGRSLTETERRDVAEACTALAGDRCRTGPIFYSANAGGAEVTRHIEDAQANGFPSTLNFQARDGSRPTWRREFPDSACGVYDTSTQDCDEYPFWSTVQGYHRERGDDAPSLRPVGSASNSSHGTSFGRFRDQCRREIVLQRQDFEVVPVPTLVSPTTGSFWTCSDREPNPSGNLIDVVLFEDPFVCDDTLRPAGQLFGFRDGEDVVLEWAGGSSEDVAVAGAREFSWRCVAGIDVRFRAVGLESGREVEFTMPTAREGEVRVPCVLQTEEAVTPSIRGFRQQDREPNSTYAFPLEPYEACYDLADYGPDADVVRVDQLELVTEVGRAGGYSKVEKEDGRATWVRTENLVDTDCGEPEFTTITQPVRFTVPANTPFYDENAALAPYPWCAGEPTVLFLPEAVLEVTHFSPDGWVRDTGFNTINHHVSDLQCVELPMEAVELSPALSFEVTPESGFFATVFDELECAPVLGATGSLPGGTIVSALGLVRYLRDSPQRDSVFIRFIDDRGLSTFLRREDVTPIEGTPPDCEDNATRRPFNLDDRDWFVDLDGPAQLYYEPVRCAAASRLVENPLTNDEFQEVIQINSAVQVLPMEQAGEFTRIRDGGTNEATWVETNRLVGLGKFSAVTEAEAIGICDSAGAFAGAGFETSFCIYTNGPQIKSVLGVEFGSGGVGASIGFGLTSANTADLDRLGGTDYCIVASPAVLLGVEGAYCTSQPDGFAQTFTGSVTFGPELDVSGLGAPLAVRETRGRVDELRPEVREAVKTAICTFWAPFRLASARINEICDTPLGEPGGTDLPEPGPPFGDVPTTEVRDGQVECPTVSGDGSVVAFIDVDPGEAPRAPASRGTDRWVTVYQPESNALTRIEIPPIVNILDDEEHRSNCPSVSLSGDVVVFTAPTLYEGNGFDCGVEHTPGSFDDDPYCNGLDGLIDVYAYEVRSGNLTNLTTFWQPQWVWRFDEGVGAFARASAFSAVVSGDGRTVAFRREEQNSELCATGPELSESCLVATGPLQEVPLESWVMLDVTSGVTTEIPVDVDAEILGLSIDGDAALFDVNISGLDDDLYFYSRASGTASRIAQEFREAHLSADGSVVVYQADNADNDPVVYVYRTASGTTDEIGFGRPSSVSADGTKIGVIRFSSEAPEGFSILDVATGRATAIDAGDGRLFGLPSGLRGTFLSGDGTRAIVAAKGSNDAFSESIDYYLYDATSAQTVRITTGAFLEAYQVNLDQAELLKWPNPMSADGSTLVFRTDAIGFVPGMISGDSLPDLFVTQLP